MAVRVAIYNCLLLAVELGLLAPGWRRARWAWLGVMQPVAAAFLGLVLSADTFGAMRLTAYGVFVHAPLFAVALGMRLRAVSRALALAATAIAVVLGAIGWDAFFIEPHALEVTRVQLSSSKLTRRLRIAVLADVQMRVLGDYERTALRRVLAEAPDLIVFAGDYVQADSMTAQHTVVRELGEYLASIRFSAPLGVYAAPGNVDHSDWAASFAAIHALTFDRTATLNAGEIQITGLAWRDSFDPELSVAPSSRYHIVFGHAPDFARGNVAGDLLIAGHTHGGQVRLPWFGPLITFSTVPRSWAAGVTELDRGRTLIVSRGIGLERGHAPELRFLCRPEIVVVQIDPVP